MECEAFEELKEDCHETCTNRQVQSESGEEGKTEFAGSCEPSCEVVSHSKSSRVGERRVSDIFL